MKVANSRGYTLIELLIGMTIITVVFTVGVAGFRSFSRRQALSGVTKSVLADLRSAQQFALNGQKPTGVCTVLDGYGFEIVSPTSYKVFASCSPASELVTKNVTLGSNMTITGNISSVMFKALGHGTNLNEDLILTLTHQNLGTTNQITIGIGGNIE